MKSGLRAGVLVILLLGATVSVVPLTGAALGRRDKIKKKPPQLSRHIENSVESQTDVNNTITNWSVKVGLKPHEYISSSSKSQRNTITIGTEVNQNGIITSGHVVAINTTTGEVKWKVETTGGVSTPPTVSDNATITTTYYRPTDPLYSGGYVYNINSQTGSVRWKKFFNSSISGSASVYKRYVIVGTTGGKVYALSKNTGDIIWRHKFIRSTGIRTKPHIFKSHIFIGGTVNNSKNSGFVAALSARDGHILWRRSTPWTIEGLPGLSTDNNHIFARSVNVSQRNSSTQLYSFGLKSGAVKWHREFNLTLRPAIVSGRMIYVSYNKIYALGDDTGKTIWSNYQYIDSPSLVKQDSLYTVLMSRTDPVILKTNRMTGKTDSRFKSPIPQIWSINAVSNSKIYVSNSKRIVAISKSAAKMTSTQQQPTNRTTTGSSSGFTVVTAIGALLILIVKLNR